MSRKIGRVLSIDIMQHAGARESGRFRHNESRYTLFWAFLRKTERGLGDVSVSQWHSIIPDHAG